MNDLVINQKIIFFINNVDDDVYGGDAVVYGVVYGVVDGDDGNGDDDEYGDGEGELHHHYHNH